MCNDHQLAIAKTDPAPVPQNMGTQRLDKWLFYTRLVKTRSLAARLVTGGKIRLNSNKCDKPATTLRCGDVVAATIGSKTWLLQVIAPGKRRGPAPEALTLYTDLTPTPSPGHEKTSPGRLGIMTVGQRDAGAGRPTKRDRRQLDRLRPREG